ncbi:hypothetical protein BD414DRAFT_477447 [Trametes punicea]|nr:hypothetical protein BD414DRAFT_477447 [Trametes punicea]
MDLLVCLLICLLHRMLVIHAQSFRPSRNPPELFSVRSGYVTGLALGETVSTLSATYVQVLTSATQQDADDIVATSWPSEGVNVEARCAGSHCGG